jgi:hydroxymethylbilane synthase
VSASLRIGTRGSALALAQANWVRTQLQGRDGALQVELVVIKTSGDRFVDQPLTRLGGKGLFVKEIEDALLAGQIDCAVHSMKDLPAALAAGLVIAAVPPRADPRDVLIAPGGTALDALPRGARVGTTSLRRTALLLHLRPDLDVRPLRGNIDTRLRRLDAGELDAIVLAAAGLQRLGLDRDGIQYCDPRHFVPAIGQGALAVESRDDATRARLMVLDDAPTRVAVTAERAFMVRVGGSCHTPLAAHARLGDDRLDMDALIASPDGARVLRASQGGDLTEAAALGARLADALLAQGGRGILAALGDEGAATRPPQKPPTGPLHGR